MITSKKFKFTVSWKIQKSKYLESGMHFFPLVQKCQQLHLEGYIMAKKCFSAEVTLSKAKEERFSNGK